ncbi:MAG: hypothetical protein D6786_09235, partial [Gammaproteobacteria bacterium]
LERLRVRARELPGPGAGYWLGVCLTACGRPDEALDHLERAHAVVCAEGASPLRQAIVLAAIEAILHHGRSLLPLDDWFDRLGPVASPDPAITGPGALPGLLLALTFRRPDHSDLAGWRELVEALLERPDRSAVHAPAAHALLVHHLWAGETRQALPLIERLSALVERGGGAPSLTAVFLHVGRAVHEFLDGRPADCIASARTGLSIADAAGIPAWNSHLRGFAAAAALSAGDDVRAEGWLREMAEGLDHGRRFDTALYHMLQVWLLLDREEGARALGHAEHGLREAQALGATVPQFVACYQMALVCHEEGNGEAAREQLRAAGELAIRLDNPMLRFMHAIARARLALDGEGELEPALREALAIGRGRDYLGCWCWQPRLVARLCGEALRRGIEPEYVRSLVWRRLLPAPDGLGESSSWPWPVRIHTLGRFELSIRGGPPSLGRKPPHMPLTLLRVLIALGGRDVPRERVIELLWPDSEPEVAAKTLSVTLGRLRRLLELEQAVVANDGNLALNPSFVWLDVWAFERACPANGSEPEGSSGMLAATLAEYRGPFLPDTEAPWAIVMRERLAQRFSLGLRRHGQTLEAQGLWRDAAALYRRGIDSAPLDEHFHERLIHCLLEQRRHGEALEALMRCERLLTAHGLPVTPELNELRNRIHTANP